MDNRIHTADPPSLTARAQAIGQARMSAGLSAVAVLQVLRGRDYPIVKIEPGFQE